MEINETIGLMAVIGTIISLVIALITAATSARASSFRELKEIVALLKARQKELEQDIETERNLRLGYERYTRALSEILKNANIPVPDMKDFFPEPVDK